MDNEKQKLQIKDLVNKDKARYVKPGFHKINTVDNLFSMFFGFQSGMLLVEGKCSQTEIESSCDHMSHRTNM